MAQQTWFITGISTGLGRGLAEKLLERGERVLGTVRKLEQVADLQARYGERLWVGRLDLTEASAIRPVVDEAFARAGRVDVVVNNAGYGLFGAAEELTDEQIERQVATNLLGSIHVIRAALPHLRAQGGGRVLQVSSTGGQFAFPAFSLYHATKWGIEGFVESVAQEVASFGIGVTLVEPGGTATNFASGMVSPPAMVEYEQTPVGHLRRMVAENAFPLPGDPGKVVQAMIDSVAQHPAPLRLALGSDTYTLLRQAYAGRLQALEAQKSVALAADVHPIEG